MSSLTKKELVDIITKAGFLAYEYNIADRVIRGEGAIEAVTSYTPEEFNNSDIHWWTNLMHPDEVAGNREVQIRILAKGGEYHGNYRIKTKSGEYIWLRDDGFAYAKDPATNLSTKMCGLISRTEPKANLVAASL